MTQSREKEKIKQKEKTQKINKTTRNLVSGYYPEMRFFYWNGKEEKKEKKKEEKEETKETKEIKIEKERKKKTKR